jgi:serine/threonine-protein kinase
MADVYLAEHVALKKEVAVKVLHDHLAERGDVVQRFALEGKAAARIRHPNIVDVTDVGADKGHSFLVMELLEGEPLSRYLQRVGPLSPRQSAILMVPVLMAVAHAHRVGVLHRDLKPANIFLTKAADGGIQPKVLDFGISKVLGDAPGQITITNSFVGTPAYCSPEQLLGNKDLDGRTDQYSLGVVLYLCVTGRLPFNADAPLFELMLAVNEGKFLPPSKLRPDLPPEFEAIVLRAMSKARSQRFASIDELRAALGPFATQSQSDPLPRSDVSIDSPDIPEGQSTSHVRTRGSDAHIAKTVINHQTPFPTPMPVHPRGVELTPPVPPSLMQPAPARRGLVLTLIAIAVGLVSIAGATLAGIYVGRSTSERADEPPSRAAPPGEERPAAPPPPSELRRETEVVPTPPPAPPTPPEARDGTPPEERVEPAPPEQNAEQNPDERRSTRDTRSRVRVRRPPAMDELPAELEDPFPAMTQSVMTQPIEPPPAMIVLEPPRSMTDNLDPWAE